MKTWRAIRLIGSEANPASKEFSRLTSVDISISNDDDSFVAVVGQESFFLRANVTRCAIILLQPQQSTIDSLVWSRVSVSTSMDLYAEWRR